ncbi:MAG: hypothetical protein EU535_08205 [Promethearchaeota archaeon]|nr:MAG: hypothetical protein EU535_08205 [Candidatus Lokiarchaeota archaeon]
MKMMDEIERKKMIREVIEYGGIGLRRQTLRIHKNGAKFPISKNYIDDEVLNPDTTYTIILIPEVKIASETSVLLSFFTRGKGPTLFYAYPEKALTQAEMLTIIQNMDQAYKKEYFIQQSSTIPSCLNYYFNIPSAWARGNKEMLLMSLIIDKPITTIVEEMLHPICRDFAMQLKNDENTFKALYINHTDRVPENERPKISIYSKGLKERLKQFYIQVVQTLET